MTHAARINKATRHVLERACFSKAGADIKAGDPSPERQLSDPPNNPGEGTEFIACATLLNTLLTFPPTLVMATMAHDRNQRTIATTLG